MEEHQKRIEAKNGRISHIGSKQERSKNQFDPVAHPVYLFRNEKNKKDVCMDYMMTQLMPKQRTLKTSQLRLGQTQKSFNPDNKKLSQSPNAQSEAMNQDDQDESFNIDNYDEQLKKDKIYYKKQEEQRRLVDFKNEQFLKDFSEEIPKTKNDRNEDYDFIKASLI